MSHLTLFDVPSTTSFSPDPDGRRQLQRELDSTYRTTRVTQPGSVRELRLDPRTNRTQNGFRYISSALFRVCRVAAPGLSKTIVNLAQGGRGSAHMGEASSLPVACAVFNQVIDLRFSGMLSQHQLVVDEERRTVEGFLGPKTHYLENAAFVELAEDVLKDARGVEFAGASLVGRRLFVRYLRPEAVATPGGSFRVGYAFCLTESGDDAIRAYALYQREECGGACLAAFSSRRHSQKRTGGKFLDKLKQLLASLLRAEPIDVGGVAAELGTTPVLTSADPQSVTRGMQMWHRRLVLAGVPQDIAKRIIARFLEQDQVTGAPMTDSRLLSKTLYHMFLLVIDEGRGRGQRVRELVERAAFKVFFGEDHDE